MSLIFRSLFPSAPEPIEDGVTLGPTEMVDRAYAWEDWADAQKSWAITFALYTIVGMWIFARAPIAGTVACIASTFACVVAANLSHIGDENFLDWLDLSGVNRL